ncbi:hypothetical protein JCM11641_000168 [Rhodosporidiobolus odoratus]
MAPSPPKPWERTGTLSASATSTLPSATSAPPVTGAIPSTSPSAISTGHPASTTSSITAAPALPDRPPGMTAMAATPTGAYGSVGTLATSPYSASPYSSPYSRYGSNPYNSTYGGYGSSLYGNSGMYGSSMYGGYGGGMYGRMGGVGGGMYGSPMGGMGGGMYGPGPGGGMAELSLSQRMEHGTAATFGVLQSLVGAVGGFAQMLESTFMATHSSFFAMIGVAEQFAHLRNYLGQVLSVFALIRWCKGILYRLVAKVPPGEGGGITAEGFQAFQAGAAGGGGGPDKPKLSKRPLFVFLLAVFGLPWAMNRLVRLITARQEAEAAAQSLDLMGRPLPSSSSASSNPNNPTAPLDPSQLTFVRTLHAYTPSPETADKELTFTKDEVLAILSPTREERLAQAKADKIEGRREGEGASWWMGRTRDGRLGWLPSNFVAELPMNGVRAGAEGKKVETGQQKKVEDGGSA